MTTNLHDKMLKAIDAYFSASDAVEKEEAEDLLLDVRDELLKQLAQPDHIREATKMVEQPRGEATLAQQETKQSEIFCGVDIADGVLSVSVLRRRTDNVAELIHCEQIQLPAQQDQTDWESVAADQAMTIAMLKDEQPAQQSAERGEPVAVLYGSLPVYDKPTQQDLPDLIAGALGVSRGTAYDMMREALAEQPAREWVNLTVDELIDLEHKHLRHEDLAQAIEAKLKEKNT